MGSVGISFIASWQKPYKGLVLAPKNVFGRLLERSATVLGRGLVVVCQCLSSLSPHFGLLNPRAGF